VPALVAAVCHAPMPGKRKTKRRSPQNVLRLPDLDHAKASVLANETLTANLSPPMLKQYWSNEFWSPMTAILSLSL
jgi:hypothetical protein